MRSTKLMWRITGFIGLLSTLLFVAGFVYAVHTILNPKGEELPPFAQEIPAVDRLASKDKLQILALGDSLTKGVGDSSGEGYVGRVKRGLEQEKGKPVYVWNFAVSGAKTNQLLDELKKPSTLSYVKQADVVLLTIGGNDLNQYANEPIAAGGSTGAAANAKDIFDINFEETKKRMSEALGRLDKSLSAIAGANPEAKVVYVGLYHPFLDFDTNREGSVLIQEWNHQAFLIANRYPNMTVVPTYDFFQYRLNDLLFTDHFHPSSDGYMLIADRIMQVLK